MSEEWVVEKLEPKYDNAKSFYGKAVVREYHDHAELYSYGELVARAGFDPIPANDRYNDYITSGGYPSDTKVTRYDAYHVKNPVVEITKGGVSTTTFRHIKEFVQQFDGWAKNRNEYIQRYGVDSLDPDVPIGQQKTAEQLKREEKAKMIDVPKPVAVDVQAPAKTVARNKNDLER